MSGSVRGLNSIRDVLKASVGSSVPIILFGGRRIVVRVIAVEDDMLIAAVRCKIVTINICCICAVVINCEALLRFLLKDNFRHEKSEEREESRRSRRRSDSLFESDVEDLII